MRTILAIITCGLMTLRLPAQVSDYEVRKNFLDAVTVLQQRIDEATHVDGLDSLKTRLYDIEREYIPHREFLDRALYPETFEQKIAGLRSQLAVAYNRVALISDQSQRVVDLEALVAQLSNRLDSLDEARNSLFSQLQQSQAAVTQLRESARRFNQIMTAKDRLIAALVDSLFLSIERSAEPTDAQRRVVADKLQRASIAARIYDIAGDNMRFIGMTKLRGRDYVSLIDQYSQFRTRWQGLSARINAVYDAAPPPDHTGAGKKGTGAEPVQPPGVHVDSLLVEWGAVLQSSFWTGIAEEFTSRGVAVAPFSDGATFSSAIRALVDSLQRTDADPTVFVKHIWTDRIDKDWREALIREPMLGRTEYASLDRLVSELGAQRVDQKFMLYTAAVVVLVFIGWWFLKRKPAAKQAA
jgi:hypothetical protein